MTQNSSTVGVTLTEANSGTTEINVSSYAGVGAKSGGTHHGGRETKGNVDPVLVGGTLRKRNEVRWNLKENEHSDLKPGISQQTLELCLDGLLPVKASLYLVCHYRRERFVDWRSKPPKGEVLEMVFKLKDV